MFAKPFYVDKPTYEFNILNVVNKSLRPDLALLVLSWVPFCTHACCYLFQPAIAGYCDAAEVCVNDTAIIPHHRCRCCSSICGNCGQGVCQCCSQTCEKCDQIRCSTCQQFCAECDVAVCADCFKRSNQYCNCLYALCTWCPQTTCPNCSSVICPQCLRKCEQCEVCVCEACFNVKGCCTKLQWSKIGNSFTQRHIFTRFFVGQWVFNKSKKGPFCLLFGVEKKMGGKNRIKSRALFWRKTIKIKIGSASHSSSPKRLNQSQIYCTEKQPR